MYRELRRDYLQQGNKDSLQKAQVISSEQQNVSLGDRDRLYGYLEGGGKVILPEPESLLTNVSVMPGLMARK